MTDSQKLTAEEERLTRWRLVLGKDAESSTTTLTPDLQKQDDVLSQLYQARPKSGRGGLGGSRPKMQRWLGDIREYFPKSVVRVMQKDAFERLGLAQMLLEPEVLDSMEVDVDLVATLLSLTRVIPERTKETARIVVKRLVDRLLPKLSAKTISAVKGSLNRATRTNRPRLNELDFDRTIRKNLANWDVERQKLLADRFVGYGRKRRSLYDVVLCVDESGSMARSVVYSSIFGAVLASMPTLSTRMVVFDTNVVDLTERLRDPIDLLFGAQLGGGTDISRALAYCQSKITRPQKTLFVLITDLEDGYGSQNVVSRARAMKESGVNFICLTALDDGGAPCFNEALASALAACGIPSFACTPDLFPDLLAAAINKQDVGAWAGRNNIRTTPGRKEDVE